MRRQWLRPIACSSQGLQYQLELFTHKVLQQTVDLLNEISVEELQDTLDNVDGTKPTQRP